VHTKCVRKNLQVGLVEEGDPCSDGTDHHFLLILSVPKHKNAHPMNATTRSHVGQVWHQTRTMIFPFLLMTTFVEEPLKKVVKFYLNLLRHGSKCHFLDSVDNFKPSSDFLATDSINCHHLILRVCTWQLGDMNGHFMWSWHHCCPSCCTSSWCKLSWCQWKEQSQPNVLLVWAHLHEFRLCNHVKNVNTCNLTLLKMNVARDRTLFLFWSHQFSNLEHCVRPQSSLHKSWKSG